MGFESRVAMVIGRQAVRYGPTLVRVVVDARRRSQKHYYNGPQAEISTKDPHQELEGRLPDWYAGSLLAQGSRPMDAVASVESGLIKRGSLDHVPTEVVERRRRQAESAVSAFANSTRDRPFKTTAHLGPLAQGVAHRILLGSDPLENA